MSRTSATTTLLIAIAVISAGPAHAEVITYNESVSGDLTSSSSLTINFGPLAGGDFLFVVGTLDGGTPAALQGPDESDLFRFTTTASSTLGFTSITPGTSGGVAIFLYRVEGNNIIFLNAFTASSANNNVFGPLPSATYLANIVPQGNIGTAGYTVTVAVAVPEPSSLALCGLAGLSGLPYARARRKAIVA